MIILVQNILREIISSAGRGNISSNVVLLYIYMYWFCICKLGQPLPRVFVTGLSLLHPPHINPLPPPLDDLLS